jgi:hypothetical protein
MAGFFSLKKRDTSHDGSRGAHAGNEMRDPALGIAPDFRPGRLVVRQRVVLVGELVEDHALAFGHHPVGKIARRFHAARLGCQQQFGAEGAHGLAALDTLVLGHDQDHAVAAYRRRHRQGDAGIARGGLDQRVTGLDAAAFLGLADH